MFPRLHLRFLVPQFKLATALDGVNATSVPEFPELHWCVVRRYLRLVVRRAGDGGGLDSFAGRVVVGVVMSDARAERVRQE